MKWRVLWYRENLSIGLLVCEDAEQAKRLHDDRKAAREFVWIENGEGRAVDRAELDTYASAPQMVLS
jgi:hypothetical protein